MLQIGAKSRIRTTVLSGYGRGRGLVKMAGCSRGRGRGRGPGRSIIVSYELMATGIGDYALAGDGSSALAGTGCSALSSAGSPAFVGARRIILQLTCTHPDSYQECTCNNYIIITGLHF